MSNSQAYLTQLRENLNEYFTLEQLRTLCFDLNVDYDSLSGESKEGKTVALISNLERHHRIPELVEKCRKQYPNVTWENMLQASRSDPNEVEPPLSQPNLAGLPSKKTVIFLLIAAALGTIVGVWVGSHSQQLFDASIPIESLSSHVFTWGGDFDADSSTGGRSSISDVNFIKQGTSYEVSYFLPEVDNLWAGISFVLSPQNKDLTAYREIELTLDLGAGTGCTIFIGDDSGARGEVVLGSTIPPNSDIRVATTKQSQRINIPLKTNFNSVELKSAKEIAFYVGSGYPLGNQKFLVSNIRLLK